MRKNNLVIRRITHTETVLCELGIEEIHLDYVQSFRKAMQQFGANPSLIINMLKPFVVFAATALNGKVLKETDIYVRRCVYGVGPCGFSDTRFMVEWINTCLKPYILAHLTTETRNAMHEEGCIFIPLLANSTSKVQLFDVGINKPFKNNYKRQRGWLTIYLKLK
jgi:hypothetical protein